MTAFLAINPRSATPQARRMDFDGTDAAFGVTIAAGSSDPNSGNREVANQRICQIGPGNPRTLIAFVGSQVWRSTDAGASWTAVSADWSAGLGGFPLDTGSSVRGGPYIARVGGVERAFVWFQTTTANRVRLAYSDDGGVTWSVVTPAGDPGDLGFNFNTVGGSIVPTWWRNRLHWGHYNSRFAVVDPAGPTIAQYALTDNFTPADNSIFGCCVKDDRFFGSWMSNTGLILRLYEFDGSAWTVVGTVDGANSYSAITVGAIGRPMWVDPTTGNIMLLAFRTSDSSWRLYEVTSLSPLAVTERTSILPAAMSTPGVAATTRAQVIVDQQHNPGGVPRIVVGFTTNHDTGTYTWYLYTNNATAMTALGTSGGSAPQYGIPWQVNLGGSQFFTDGENHVSPVSRTSVTGGIRYGFRLNSVTGTDIVRVRGRYKGPLDRYATNTATLSDPSAGTLTGGNTVEGLVADNTTVYFVTVPWSAMGFVSGQRPDFTLEVLV